MSTSAVSSSSIYQELQSFYQNRKADLSQLGSDLQSGNLSAAQQDFSALVALGQSGPFASSELFSKSGKDQAFAAIGQALQSSDLAGAQAAFATLTNTATPVTWSPAAIVNLSGAQHSPEPPVSSTSSIYQQLQAYAQAKKADIAQLGKDLQSGNLSAAQQDYNTLAALGQTGPSKNGQTFQRAGRETDFQAIGQALQSGDLAGAQSAFAKLESTYGGQNPQAQSAISAYASNPIEIVINLGGPTSTGSAPTNPQPPIILNPPVSVGPTPVAPPIAQPPIVEVPPISAGPVPVAPPISTSTGSSVPEIVINLGSGSSSSTPEEIQINLGGASSTSASSTSASSASTTPEVVINLPNQSSSSSPEEVTINLGSGSSGAQISIDSNQGRSGSAANELTINLNPQTNYELILNLLNSNSTSSSGNAVSVSA